jgi:phage tail-like protein
LKAGAPTYWMLDALTGWRTGSLDNAVTDDGQLALTKSGGGYDTSGTWISAPLDGALPGCQWHRIEMRVDDLPPGTALEVATYSADDDAIPVSLPDDGWSVQPRLVGSVPRPDKSTGRCEDLLIQSPPGRYLWLRLRLAGDGYGTPAVRQLVVHYPRTSYLRYLPGVYGANDAGRWFLDRFLSIPQTEWDGLRERIATIAQYFDPRAVPDGRALAYLASWLDAEFEPEWTADDQRRLLCLLPRLRGIRGTARAVRDTTRVYLRSIAGEAADAFQYPYLLEGFRERNWLALAPATHGRAHPAVIGDAIESRLADRRLWSAGVVRRLQLGGTAQAGYSRLISTGDPATDPFACYANRVRAVAPAGWVRTAAQQRLLERGLRVELPAHVAAKVTLVEPYFQAGVQATLGIDTVAGPPPVMRLRSSEPVTPDRASAPARRPRGRLGYDTVLAGERRSARHEGTPGKGHRS